MSCQKDCMLIGIAGGTGSGKSTFTNRIKKQFGDDVTVIYHDNYYRRRDDIPFEERKKINYDHPDALETDMLIEHIKQLKAGKSVVCPVYDFSVHNRSDKTVVIKPSKVILVEGILVLQNPELCNVLDIKIFVDTDADARLIRRILRDCGERERSVESVCAQYRATVKPMHEKYVEPSKKFADIIVVGGGNNLVALDMISTKVEKLLNK